MMRIAALNDSSCESSNDEDVGPTQEILEAHATRFYRKAISHLAKEELSEAKEAIFEILKNPYIEKAGWRDEAERPKALPQDIALKYSCFKNLGNIHMSEKKYEEASKYYMKAVYLDSTEVTLWQKLGASAIKIKDFQLAIIAFQEGLLINPNHWPCLDQLLSVLFILGLYEDCLCIAITSLQRDPYYVKALAFKDYIFETQPHLKSFAKEYFKESDILFENRSYEKAMGDKFINTCLSLRPHQKSFHSFSPVKLPQLSKNITNFNWIELIDIIKTTYDQLILEDPKMFVARLEFRSFIKDLLDLKVRESIKDNLRNNLNNVFKPGRRLSRSLSVNDDSILKQKCNNDTGIIEGLPENLKTGLKTVISKRRQTIELGESQESFRINNRRNTVADPKCKTAIEVDTDKMVVIPASIPEESEMSKLCNGDSYKEAYAVEEKKIELSKEKAECIGDTSVLDGTTVKSGKDINDMTADCSETDILTKQVQSAADQLKDIMEIKTSTKILNLNHSQLGIDEDFYEYFDGGVYEEEDEEDDDDDEVDDDDDDEMECDDGTANSVEKGDADIQIISELNPTPSKNNVEGKSEDKNANFNNAEKKAIEEAQILKGDGEVTSVHSHSTVADKEISTKEIKESSDTVKETANAVSLQAVTPKKPKRGKRGLERELEQLDYWGRRKAREAKRRRRTLTSKLVGDFEQNEYLTWAHLIRSFIPAALLSQEECSILKGAREKLNEKNAKEAGGEKSSKDYRNQSDQRSLNMETDCADRNEELIDKMPKNSNITFLDHFGCSFDISLWNKEELEVGEFLHLCENNGGILDVLQQCQKELIKKYDRAWPLKCALGYIDLHQRIRKHITVGATLNLKEDPLRLFNFAHTTLIYIELLLSLSRLPSNESFNREESSYNLEQIINEENNLLEEDLFDVHLLLGRPDVWREKYFEAHLRVAWVQSQIKIIQGFPEEGVFHLEVLLEQMLLGQREEETPLSVKSSRVEGDDLILSTSHIQKELNLLQRSQLLENIEAKFKGGFYEEVVHILTSYFGDSNTKVGSGDLCPPRYVQLLILVESLVNIKDIKRTIQWGSLCLNEAVDKFHSNDVDEDERKKWTETLRDILLLLLELVIEEPKLVFNSSHEELVKMVASLVNVLVIQLELGSSLPEPYFSTLSPWIVLHTILSQYEEQQAKRKTSERSVVELDEEGKNDESDQGSSAMPSTLLLITAHDELGKNEWCCIEEGKFLLYMMDVLMEELDKPLSEEPKLSVQQAMEQIMFCLFLHPSRKTKYRHLRDHNGHSIPLTWTRALQLFKFYLPQQLPEFQSDQFPSISDDVSALFRRILSLLPEEYKHEDQTKLVEDYIDRQIESDKLLAMKFPRELKDCYYLLADNYFKGKEWEQAIQYYKLDASINTKRIDSWSPMGLAKKAQLETLLNSCEIIRNTEELFKDAQRASRCLDRGLQLDPYFCNIWVEKGGLVYMIHSHASRLLKQELDPDMSIEMFESLEKIKGDMLNEASKCFSNASKIVEEGWDDEDLPDERWLYQYMLGKLAEKTNKGPEIVFYHYLDASRRLHNMGAKYPAKISYCNPVEYSVEVLEVYFRIHVYIFKYLHQREGKDVEPSIIKMFKIVIEKLSQSPFVLCKEKEIHNSNSVLDVTSAANKGPINDKEEPPSKKLKNNENIDIDALLGEDLNKLLNSLKSEAPRAGTETNSVSPEKSEGSPLKGVDDKERINLILKCVEAFELCVKRFPHHYKSLYRLAYFYHTSKTHKDNYKARNILLGCDSAQNFSYMPSNGLFVERKISTMNPKNSNLFNGVWRIPHDEIDRPGSFAAHMYRCVSLCLDILHETKDFYTFLEIAIALRHSPDKDKKYLRDNERELLFEHATQVGIQTMKDKYRQLFKSSTPLQHNKCHSFIVDVYRAYKQMSKYLSTSESPFSKMLIESFSSFKGLTNDNSTNLLKEAEKYCVGYPSTSVISSINSNVHSQNGIRNGVPSTPSMHGFVRRGRPPGPSRDFNTFRFRAPQENKSIAATNPSPTTSGQSVAVQQAYKVYENLIQAQTILHNKNLDDKSLQYYKGKYEEYKQQMLKYLQISSVSQFFHSSLQSLGTSASKLPPPPPITQAAVTSQNKSTSAATATTAATTTTPNKVTTFTHNKHSLDSLAEKSKAHGISISAVSKKVEPVISKPVKPSMSITLSQSSKPCTSISGGKISLVSLGDKNLNKVDLSRNTTAAATTTTTTTTTPITTTAKATTTTTTTTATSTVNSTLPKLPPGTTLSRQPEQQTSGNQKISHSKEHDKPKPKSLSSISSALSSKGSVTITHAKPSDISTTKKHSSTSFQAVFQASIAKPKVDISPVSTKDSSTLPASKHLQQGIKLSSLKHFKADDKRWETISHVLSSNKTNGGPVSTSAVKTGGPVSTSTVKTVGPVATPVVKTGVPVFTSAVKTVGPVSTSTVNLNAVTTSVNTSTVTVTAATKNTTSTSEVQSSSKSGESCQIKLTSKPTNSDKTNDPCIITID